MTQQKILHSADALVDIALNAACFAVQEDVVQTDGGPASVFFSGSYETAFTKLFKPYCELELQDAEERAQDQKANSKPVIKYYIGDLSVRRGEDVQNHRVRFSTDGDPDQYLDNVAERFIDDEGSPEDDGYWHEGGTIFVTPKSCREIPKAFYLACHQFNAVEPV